MSARRRSLCIAAVVAATLMAGCVDTGAFGDGDGDDEPTDSAGNDANPGGDAGGSGADAPGAGPGTSTPPGGSEPGEPSTGTGGNASTGNTTTGNATDGNFTEHAWPAQAEARIRPGVQVQVAGSICTTNFLYRSPLNGTYYLGIAAHCVYNELGAPVFLSSAIGVLGNQGIRIGKVAYSSYHELGLATPADGSLPVHEDENDLALIQLDQAALNSTHPSMKHFGGPTGVVGSLSTIGLGDKVLAHGDTPSRPGPDQLDRLEGYVRTTTAPWTINAYFVPYSFQGDSGSAVITADGLALGVLVSLATVPPGETGISFLPPMLEYAAAKGFPVEVVTWEQFDDGLLPA